MVSIFFSEEWLAYLEEVVSWGSRGASFARWVSESMTEQKKQDVWLFLSLPGSGGQELQGRHVRYLTSLFVFTKPRKGEQGKPVSVLKGREDQRQWNQEWLESMNGDPRYRSLETQGAQGLHKKY